MFDLDFFMPLIKGAVVVVLAVAQILLFLRFVVFLINTENARLRIWLILAIIPLAPIAVYLNLVFIYIIGGGH